MQRYSPRTLGVLVALGAAAALGVAYAAEVWGGLVPCALCLLERWPYRGVLVLGLLAANAPSGLASFGAAERRRVSGELSPGEPSRGGAVRGGLAQGGLARGGLARGLLVLAVLTLLAEAGIAAVHVGVEWQWWPSPLPECAAPRLSGGSIAERLASMPARPSKPCDEPSFLIPGVPISMAAMNLVFALAFSAGLAISLLRSRSRR